MKRLKRHSDGEMSGHGCMHYVRLVGSVIGVSVGILACLAFSFGFHHTVASVFAFLSAVFASVCLTLHILHHRHILQDWHTPHTLHNISQLGFCVFIIGFGFTVWFIFYGAYYHQGLMPIEDNPYLSAVWTFMTSKWGLLLWSGSRRYSRLLESDPLLSDE